MGAAALLVVLGVLTPSANSAATSTTRITLDQRGRVFWSVEDVGHQVLADCQGITQRVSVRVITRHRSFGESFNCADVNGHPASVVPQLIDLAAKQPGVTRRARRVIAIDNALPVSQRTRVGVTVSTLTWYLAAESYGRCRRADNLEQIRDDIMSALRAGRESPEQWTTVEAVWIAGVCPAQLSTLYRSVARVGYPKAASTVKRAIQQASKPRRQTATT